ncbi:VOC family protein [Paracoccus sp. DMF]|uniref:VOC family protein n=1 Tax=Paracoccus sp. DMF TaxID=400837 RepID=UPI0011007484|nr:VOC family protein [Paracoccus sp. DMF]MCV2448374.1 VOC family protein [Paracoccus sp. DMF]
MKPVLDHIGIAVAELQPALEFYGRTLGLGQPVIRLVPELGLRLAFFDNPAGPIIELVEASGKTELRPGDVVVALEVEDLDAAIAEYRARGLRVYDQPPTANLPLRRGWITKAGGHGNVIELCPKGEVAAFVRGAGS